MVSSGCVIGLVLREGRGAVLCGFLARHFLDEDDLLGKGVGELLRQWRSRQHGPGDDESRYQ
jgi:hypothetical protein